MAVRMRAGATPALGSDYKTRKRKRRLRAVLDAAEVVFAEKGYHAATLRDIADRLDLLPASLYHYLESKEAALVAVCERSGQRYITAMAAVLDRPPPIADLVREAVHWHIVSNRRELVDVFAFRRHDLPPGAASRLAGLAADYTAQWESLLRRGVDRGEFRASLDCARAAVAILSMCNGAITRYQDRSLSQVGSVAADFADILLDGIGVGRRRGRPSPPATTP